ncbi:MAG: hypothetical protein KUG77_06160 [Nannocystaceae bacterium]|nr:hypothetical protein [Nannocystaceae bacterium]
MRVAFGRTEACDPSLVLDDGEPVMARPEAPLPRLAAAAGLALAVSSAMPWTPQGDSFLALLRSEFSRGVLEGLLMLVGFGSPFLFGMAVALAPLVCPPVVARRILRVPVAFMHSQLVLVALVLWLSGVSIAALPLLGFALGSGVGLAVHTARAHAQGDGPRVGWYVRWGGMVVAAIAAWMELQRMGDLEFGWGLHVALLAGLGMVGALGGRALGSAAPGLPDAPRPSTLF